MTATKNSMHYGASFLSVSHGLIDASMMELGSYIDYHEGSFRSRHLSFDR